MRRNSIFSFLSAATRLLTNMLLFVGIARFYGPEGFGQFTVAHTYLTLFFLIADFGFDLLLTTEIARAPGRSGLLMQQFFPAKLILSLVATVAMWSVALFSTMSAGTEVLMLILGSGLLANAIASFCFAVFKGHQNLFEEMRVSLTQNVALLCVLLVLELIQAPLPYVALAFVLSRVFGVALIIPRTFALTRLRELHFTFARWREILRAGLPFGVHLLFGSLYFQLDTLLLAQWRGDQAVGIYQAAMKLIVLVLVIPDVISNVIVPVLSRLHAEDFDQWRRLARIVSKGLMYLGLPFGIIFYLYADQIIQMVYGSERYTAAAPLMRIFAFIVIVRFSVETHAMLLTTSKRQIHRMLIVICMTVLNFTLNRYAIPHYGLQGSAVVSLITNVIAGALYISIAYMRDLKSLLLVGPRQVMAVGLTIVMAIALFSLNVQSLFIGLFAV
ncbi:MAG: hypothetical protein AUI33_17285, partial [Ignavibacteria bacterium 13_1_40CM_2_61_4]